MAPKASSSGAARGRSKPSNAQAPAGNESDSSNPFESSDEQTKGHSTRHSRQEETEGDNGGGEASEKFIPQALLTRILHEFFAKDSTRISRDANAAVGKYVDIFLREAIARAALEKKGGFLEVEDLEKIAPQLLLDL